MTRALARTGASPLATVGADVERAHKFAIEAKAPATREAYDRWWRDFRIWGRGILPVIPLALNLPTPPEVIGIWLGYLTKVYKPASIDQALAAIAYAHRQRKLVFDRKATVIADVRAGLRRSLGVAQKQSLPLTPEHLLTIVNSLGESTIDVRDRAILLLGFAGAFRSAEILEGLRPSDCRRTSGGFEITIRRSKTDQEGAGSIKYIATGRKATCPVRALEAWLELRSRLKPTGDHLWIGIPRGTEPEPGRAPRDGAKTTRLDRIDLGRILARRMRAVGLDPTGYTGHAPRVGLAVTCADAQVPIEEIADAMGHKDLSTTRHYTEQSRRRRKPAAKGLI